MALQKQNININFKKGVDTKTDPFQVELGKFLTLDNMVFNVGERLTKRNGYAQLGTLPDPSATYVTTFNGDLTAIGTTLQAYASGSARYYNRGTLQPMNLSVLPLVRNNTNQSQMDSAVSANGYICTAYTDQNPTSLSTPLYRYVVADVNTGQIVINPTTISGADVTYGTPRVFLVGNYFVIVFAALVTASYHLQYLAVSAVDPSATVIGPVDITTSYGPATTLAFDGAVYNDALYMAWNGGASSGIKMAYLTANLALSASINPDATHEATHMSVYIDGVNAVAWVAYYDSNTGNGYAFALSDQAVDSGIDTTPLLAPTQIISSATGAIVNLTVVAQNNILTFLLERSNNYSYDSSVPTHFIKQNTLTLAGTLGVALGSEPILVRSIGLASEAFLYQGVPYWLGMYRSPYQSTYILFRTASSTSNNPIAKFAYGNAASTGTGLTSGYLPMGLPQVTLSSNIVQVPYLLKTLLTAVNTNTNIPSGNQIAGVYAQSEVNLASLQITTSGFVSDEIGRNLVLTGGITWAYDGSLPNECGFFFYIDSVLAATFADPTFTGDTTNGSATVASVSSVANLVVGMKITGTGIAANTTILAVGTTTLTLSQDATANNTGTTFTVTGNQIAQKYFYSAIYQWEDAQGNIISCAPSIPVSVTTSAGNSSVKVSLPTCRVTYKTNSPIKISIYRWSTAQPVYYQVTSIASPILNSLTSDSITFIDSQSDAQIIGNEILYTNGGVLENVSPPAFDSVFLYDNRLWGIVSEDKNLLWFSKQVIESTPVEMSDLLTMYIAPNIGAQGPTGPLTAGSSLDDKLILFKQAGILYINGSGPDITGANNQYSQPIFITSTAGCSNQKSIVFQPEGLMFEFQAESGNQIWLLTRDLQLQFVGAPVVTFTQGATVNSAVAVPGSNQVRFTLSTGITIVYDYYYQQWSTFSNVPALSGCLYQGLHTFINQNGQIYQETPGKYLDGSNPVLMSFTTSWINLAGLQGYQRAYQFYLMGVYSTPHKLNVRVAYDYNSSSSSQVIISPDNFSPYYGQDRLYGAGTPYGGVPRLEQWRIFMAQQRCQSFQLKIREIYDPNYGVPAGAGFSLSGINIVVGIKKGFKPMSASVSTGGS